MKYICMNPDCERYEQEEYLSSETYYFRNGKMVGKNCCCPKCGKERQVVKNPDADIPLSQKNIGINHMGSMSMEQRREVLKKRSHEHFKKEIKERKDGLINAAVSEMNDFKKGKL